MPHEMSHTHAEQTFESGETRTEEVAGRSQDAMYHTEHWLAWLASLVSVGLGVFGVLVGFGVVDRVGNDVNFNTENLQGSFFDGMVLIVPAIGAAILAFAMHQSDHHRMRFPLREPAGTRGLWATEHFFAMVTGVSAIALGVVGILVGYDSFERGNVPQDGLLWSACAIGASILSAALHSVRHHQEASEEDYIVRIVEERVRGAATPPPLATMRPTPPAAEVPPHTH